MRKDPPFDNEFLYATHILKRQNAPGAFVVKSRGQGLRDCNEKTLRHQFPRCAPEHVVTAARDIRYARFCKKHVTHFLQTARWNGLVR